MNSVAKSSNVANNLISSVDIHNILACGLAGQQARKILHLQAVA
jgi:hypothetical protein